MKNKAESNLEDEVQQSTQADTEEDSSTKISEQYPEQWTESWEAGIMVVDVQAEVHIPEVSEIVSNRETYFRDDRHPGAAGAAADGAEFWKMGHLP